MEALLDLRKRKYLPWKNHISGERMLLPSGAILDSNHFAAIYYRVHPPVGGDCTFIYMIVDVKRFQNTFPGRKIIDVIRDCLQEYSVEIFDEVAKTEYSIFLRFPDLILDPKLVLKGFAETFSKGIGELLEEKRK
jgi:hypothetical protein